MPIGSHRALLLLLAAIPIGSLSLSLDAFILEATALVVKGEPQAFGGQPLCQVSQNAKYVGTLGDIHRCDCLLQAKTELRLG